MENAKWHRRCIFQYHDWNYKRNFLQYVWNNRESRNTKWRYIAAVFAEIQLQYCSGYTASIVNNSYFLPIQWLIFRIKLVFCKKTCERYQQPSGHWGKNNQHWGTQEEWVDHWAALVNATTVWMARASQPGPCLRWRGHAPISFHDMGWRMKAVIQWEGFSNFNRLIDKIEYSKRALSQIKPATTLGKTKSSSNIEERQKAKAIIFKLLQHERFVEEMKSIEAEK